MTRLPREGRAAAERDVVREEARVQRDEAAGDEAHLDRVERGEQAAQVAFRVDAQVRRVVLELRRAAEQEAQAALQAEHVRHGPGKGAAGAQDAPYLGYESVREADV